MRATAQTWLPPFVSVASRKRWPPGAAANRNNSEFAIDAPACSVQNLAGIGNEDRTFPVDEQDFACADVRYQALVMILREFLQIERSQQDEFQLRRFRAYGVGDLQHRCPRQPAERRFQRDGPVRDQGLLEIFAVPEIEAAVGLQRVAEQAAVGIDGQYPRELRIFLAHGGKKSRTHRLVCVCRDRGHGPGRNEAGRCPESSRRGRWKYHLRLPTA